MKTNTRVNGRSTFTKFKNPVIVGNIPPDAKANRILLGANSIVNLFTIDE